MDCAIAVDAGRPPGPLRGDVRSADRAREFVIGHAGVRVFPHERSAERATFEFMNSPVSTEKPKGVAIRQIAQELLRTRSSGGKTLLGRRAGDRPHRQRAARVAS